MPMIIKAEYRHHDEIFQFCKDKILGTKVMGLLECYAFNYDFFSLMLSYDEYGMLKAVMSCFDGNITLVADDDCDFCEISEYLNFTAYKSVTTEIKTAEFLKFTDYQTKTAYKFSDYNGTFYEAQNADENDYEAVYALISENIPGSFSNKRDAYLNWLSDFTFRKVRNAARLKCIKKDQKIFSCALTSSECNFSAIISGVASDSTHRSKGAGKSVVLSLAYELKNENKDVYVIALNDSAKSFYEHIGFEKHCVLAISER